MTTQHNTLHTATWVGTGNWPKNSRKTVKNSKWDQLSWKRLRTGKRKVSSHRTRSNTSWQTWQRPECTSLAITTIKLTEMDDGKQTKLRWNRNDKLNVRQNPRNECHALKKQQQNAQFVPCKLFNSAKFYLLAPCKLPASSVIMGVIVWS